MSSTKQNTLVLQKYILDPLSTIIKLAILGKKNVGCKILIGNNQIHIQENGLFQGIARYYMGVTKNDIHYLSIPVEIACKRYLTLEKINMVPDLVIIFKCAQDGLNNLMETYNIHPIIVHCLKYYYSIIDTYLHLISCQQQLISNDKGKKAEVPSDTNKKITPEPTKPIKIQKSKNKENQSLESPDSYHTPILNIEYLNREEKESTDINIHVPHENVNLNLEKETNEQTNETELTEEQQKTNKN